MTNVLCIPHGGGPMPLMGDPSHTQMIEYLSGIEASIGRPEAIVLVSAHWECDQPTITSGPTPELIYDYGGFPPEMYELSYPAPGAPELANDVAGLLTGAGFDPKLDPDRGFDHGMFVPLMLMYPDASVPVVQLSMLSSLDPDAHIDMGAALSPLAERNVLVLGSGFTFHNMAAFMPALKGDPTSIVADHDNEAFEQWLRETCTSDELTEDTRRDRFVNWSDAPGARWAHPREEHLLPLHVCYGAGGGVASQAFDGVVLGKRSSGYSWG